MLLVDSSTIVKFFSQEPGWEKAKDYVAEASTIQLAIVELASGLRKKVLKNELSAEVALGYIKDYSDSANFLDERKYAVSAFDISIKRSIPVYDCFFIAVALAEGFDLVSSDENQLRVAEELGIKILRVDN